MIKKVKKKNYFAKYSNIAQKVLESLLDKYADTGIENIEDINILKLSPLSELGSVVELVDTFGDRVAYFQAIKDLKNELYV